MQSSNSNGGKPTRGRLLLTGNGTAVIDDLMKHTAQTNQVEKCQPTELNFESALRRLHPHTVVACLANESWDTLRMYGVMEESPECMAMPLIVIGNETDCDLFHKNVFHTNQQIFVRPLDMARFMGAVERCQSEGLSFERAQMEKKKQAEAAAEERSRPVVPVAAGMPVGAKMDWLSGELRKCILVVDDDVRMLNVIKLHLQELYDVVVVPSGKLALKYLSKKHADLVLLDYMMPEEDGPEVLRQIRESSPQASVPVLFLTGVSDKDMVMRGLEFRPSGYLLKPITRELLLEKVTEILLGL